MKKVKCIISLLLISLLVVIPLTSSKAIMVSQSDAVTWAKSQKGKEIGTGQCVDLIKAYYKYLGETSRLGDPVEYWTDNNLPTNWSLIAYTSGFIPQPGDIAVWNSNVGGGHGHVAIVISANSSSFTSMDQNWPYGSVVEPVDHPSFNNVLGVIRPYFSDSSSSGTFMFALRDPGDYDLQKSPLDTGYAVPTAGGYILKCELMEYVKISYNEYQTLKQGASLEKSVGSFQFKIRYNSTSDYDITLLDVSIDGGNADTYCLYIVPTQTQPAYLMYLGDPVILYTREVKQFFISSNTEVFYEDDSDGLYGQTGSETISEYLSRGGFSFGYDGYFAEHYLADVNNGNITFLWPEYSY